MTPFVPVISSPLLDEFCKTHSPRLQHVYETHSDALTMSGLKIQSSPSLQRSSTPVPITTTTPTTNRTMRDTTRDTTRDATTTGSSLVFAFCKADWDMKRFGLMRQEAADRRQLLMNELLTTLKQPKHRFINGWKLDLAELTPQQLEEIGGAGRIEISSQQTNTIHVGSQSEQSDAVAQAPLNTLLDVFKSFKPQVIRDLLLNNLRAPLQQENTISCEAMLMQWFKGLNAAEEERGKVYVKRFPLNNNRATAVSTVKRQRNAPKRKREVEPQILYHEPQLTLEEAEKFMF